MTTCRQHQSSGFFVARRRIQFLEDAGSSSGYNLDPGRRTFDKAFKHTCTSRFFWDVLLTCSYSRVCKSSRTWPLALKNIVQFEHETISDLRRNVWRRVLPDSELKPRIDDPVEEFELSDNDLRLWIASIWPARSSRRRRRYRCSRIKFSRLEPTLRSLSSRV